MNKMLLNVLTGAVFEIIDDMELDGVTEWVENGNIWEIKGPNNEIVVVSVIQKKEVVDMD